MLAADIYRIILRIAHIGGGVAWAGGVFLFVVFVQPSVAAIAPQGAPFMRELLGSRRMVDRIIAIASVSVIGGALLYWEVWHDYPSLGDFLGSGYGLALTIGAIAALTAFGFGIFGTRPNVGRLLALGARAAQSEGPPPPEIASELQAVQARLKVFARTSLALLGIAVLAMATAQYW